MTTDPISTKGLVPSATHPVDDAPWWLIVLSFIGAQLVVWPLLLFIVMTAGEALLESPGSWITALLLLAAGWGVLRKQVGMFVSQMGLSLLLLGMVVLMIATGSSMHEHDWWSYNAIALVGLLCAGVLAWWTPVSWMQRLFAFLGALMVMALYFPSTAEVKFALSTWGFQLVNVWVVALAWVGWVVWGEPRWITRRGHALADGVGVAALLALLVDQMMNQWRGLGMGSADASSWAGQSPLFTFSGFTLIQWAMVAAATVIWFWHTRRQPQGTQRRAQALMALIYVMLVVIAPMLNTVGPLALIGTAALLSGRRRLVLLAGFMLLADFSSFYYALQWTLVNKALLLVAMGAVLMAALSALAWRDRRRVLPASLTTPATPTSATARWAVPALLVSLVLVLSAVHSDVRRKEQVIADGQKIYIPLVPRDPRSLMQGDYMALRFTLPREVLEDDANNAPKPWWPRSTLMTVAQVAPNGVATIKRLDKTGTPLAPGEIRVPLKHLKGDWVVVTDAFFFPEGQGQPFELARFGEFRALSDGRMLLVGMADKDLRPIAPAPSRHKADEGAASTMAPDAEREASVPDDTLVTLPADAGDPTVSPSPPSATASNPAAPSSRQKGTP